MSHVPPPFSPSAPPQRRDRTGLIILFIILGLIAFCILGVVALGFFGFSMAKKVGGPMIGCAINFEAAREGIMEYAKEHEGKLPNAATWMDDVRPYIGKHLKKDADAVKMFGAKVMEENGDWGCPVSDTKMTGMAFNADLSGKLLTDVKDPYNTVLIFEIEAPKKNANEVYQPRPKSTSPTLMGENRGWISMPMEGGMRGMEDLNEGGSRFRTSNQAGDESSGAPPAPEAESK
ncbi:MAG TPA: hypothetical protein PLX06_07580 [Fimbriimonadaceae bacterium]|nr:hypothetical protein [Fimbriimonadaceae bacterium]